MQQQPYKLFKEVTVEEIKQECLLVEDLLKTISAKPSLMPIARLMAVMTLEKALRYILYNEYKTITKIKFSVLIDKAEQVKYINTIVADEFRALKEFRNACAHHGLMALETEDILMPVSEIIRQIYTLLNNFAYAHK